MTGCNCPTPSRRSLPRLVRNQRRQDPSRWPSFPRDRTNSRSRRKDQVHHRKRESHSYCSSRHVRSLSNFLMTYFSWVWQTKWLIGVLQEDTYPWLLPKYQSCSRCHCFPHTWLATRKSVCRSQNCCEPHAPASAVDDVLTYYTFLLPCTVLFKCSSDCDNGYSARYIG